MHPTTKGKVNSIELVPLLNFAIVASNSMYLPTLDAHLDSEGTYAYGFG